MHELAAYVPANQVGNGGRRYTNSRTFIHCESHLPCRVLKSLATRKRHTPPGSAIHLDKPRFPCNVTQEFDHKAAPPPAHFDELFRFGPQILRHQLRGASTRSRTLRIHHPQSPVGAPCPDSVGCCKTENTFSG